MHRKFIALIIVTAIAVTGLSAIPAHADGGDRARIWSGLAALAILGVAIHNRNQNDDAPTVSHSTQPHHQPRPVPHRVARYDLPGKCLRNHGLHGGPKRLLGYQCLQENYRFSNSLPQACWSQFQNQYVKRAGYEPQCLRERGYRIVRN